MFALENGGKAILYFLVFMVSGFVAFDYVGRFNVEESPDPYSSNG